MKYKPAIISLSLSAVVALSVLAAQVVAGTGGNIALVPLPQSMQRLRGTFTLRVKTQILVDEPAKSTGEYLAERLRNSTGMPLPIHTQTKSGRKPPRDSILLTTQGA